MNDANNQRWLRPALYILLVLNALLFAWRFSNWMQGKENIYSLGTSLGFICLFAAILVGKRNAALYYVLLGAAIVLMLASLASLFVR